jgi:hypothetical protein
MTRDRIVVKSADGTQAVLDEYERRDADAPKKVHSVPCPCTVPYRVPFLGGTRT